MLKPTLYWRTESITDQPALVLEEEIEVMPKSQQGRAKKAVKILVSLNKRYEEPAKEKRTNPVIAFAKRNKVIYGKGVR